MFYGKILIVKNIIPPPILALISIYFLYAFKDLSPSFSFVFQEILALLILIEAVIIIFFSIREFRKLETTVSPLKLNEVKSLVTGGIYKLSRNPMYLALTSIQFSAGIYFGNWLFLINIPLFIFYITHYQIIPEEKILKEKFGEKYEAYCSQTGRWF